MNRYLNRYVYRCFVCESFSLTKDVSDLDFLLKEDFSDKTVRVQLYPSMKMKNTIIDALSQMKIPMHPKNYTHVLNLVYNDSSPRGYYWGIIPAELFLKLRILWDSNLPRENDHKSRAKFKIQEVSS